jgi:hypothetical protein
MTPPEKSSIDSNKPNMLLRQRDKRGGVCTLTLNDPGAFNVLGEGLLAELQQAIAEIDPVSAQQRKAQRAAKMGLGATPEPATRSRMPDAFRPAALAIDGLGAIDTVAIGNPSAVFDGGGNAGAPRTSDASQINS